MNQKKLSKTRALNRILFITAVCLGINFTYAQQSLKVATWNLEHFKEGAVRGFPEYLNSYDPPGPRYAPRTDADYEFIANIIRDSDFKILALQEINGVTKSTLSGENKNYSSELTKLKSYLGNNWEYIIGSSGRSQRMALLFDTNSVEGLGFHEFEMQNDEIQGKGIFDRMPLAGFFRLKEEGQIMNDFVVISLHLASGQSNNRNHDEAINRVLFAINELRGNNMTFPPQEEDIIILGDFNANRFDGSYEQFWERMESDGWDILGDRKEEYNPTRLSGSPLAFRSSRIDYIIVSDGLDDNEVLQDLSDIHFHLAIENPEAFRQQASDHVPVSISIEKVPDDD